MTLGSFFAGIGGIDLGLERAGFECRWQVEIDDFCRKVLAKHWPAVTRYGDIRQLTGTELEPVDLIAGGYPCQPFSQAGKRGGEQDPRHLWPEFARLIRLLRPRGVLLENVPGHLSLGFGSVLGDLARLGYDAEWICVRASDLGASHLRKRVFVVAYDPKQLWRREPIGLPRCALSTGASAIGSRLANARLQSQFTQQRRDGSEHSGSGGELGDSTGPRFSGGQSGQDQAARDAARRQESSGRCDDLADSSERLIPQPGRGPERRDGPGSAGAILPDSAITRLEEWGRIGGDGSEERAPIERDCGNVGNAEDWQRGIGQGSWQQQIETGGSGPFPDFAPGPSDPRWPAILRGCPWLAPALESPVRGVADGVSSGLDGAMKDRTKRLSRLGNAVVPQVAEWIGRRIIAAFESR